MTSELMPSVPRGEARVSLPQGVQPPSDPAQPAGLPQSNARASGLFDAIRRGERFPSAVHESVARERPIVEV